MVALTVTRRGRRLLRLAVGLVLVLALASGGWMWLRDSSLVAVRDVRITGVTASDGEQVKAALTSAALEMTTLHVQPQALKEATANLTSVGSLKVSSDFPHTLSIQVIERQPVAALATKGERRIPVTGDGFVLRGVTAERDLPSLVLDAAAVGPKLTDRRALRRAEDRRRRSRRPAPALECARRQRAGRRRDASRMDPNWCSVRPPTRVRSGSPPRACSPRARPPARPIWTSGFPGGWPQEGSRRSTRRPITQTLNLRLRIAQLSTRGRDFGILQRSLRRFVLVDNGNEIPVPCGNPPGR